MATFIITALIFYFLGRYSNGNARIETQVIAEKIRQALATKEQFKVFPKHTPISQEAETINKLDKNA